MAVVEKNRDINMIFSDINMPEICGMNFLRWLRGQEDVASTPFCFLTAMSSKEWVDKGNELGADSWIVKPLVKDTMLAFVDRLRQKYSI